MSEVLPVSLDFVVFLDSPDEALIDHVKNYPDLPHLKVFLNQLYRFVLDHREPLQEYPNCPKLWGKLSRLLDLVVWKYLSLIPYPKDFFSANNYLQQHQGILSAVYSLHNEFGLVSAPAYKKLVLPVQAFRDSDGRRSRGEIKTEVDEAERVRAELTRASQIFHEDMLRVVADGETVKV